jgi:hypothetical protein
MGASAYGAGMEEVLSRADQLEREAAQIEVEFPEAAAQMRLDAAWARENYRTIAGGKAAVEIASEKILPEETLLTRGLSGGSLTARFAEGMGKSFVEGVTAEAGNQAINAAAFGDTVDPVELLRGGALEAAAGAPMVAVGSMPNPLVSGADPARNGGQVNVKQGPVEASFSYGPLNETTLFSVKPGGSMGSPINDKKALQVQGYPLEETEAFINHYYKPEAYAGLGGDDVVWLPAPCTSGQNPIAELLARRLAKDHGGSLASGILQNRSKQQSKNKRGYLNKLRDPVDVTLSASADLDSLRGKRVVVVDDILTSGETTDAMVAALQANGLAVSGVAVLSAANEAKRAEPRDLDKLANILAAQTAKPYKQVRADVELAHRGARASLLAKAIDEAKLSNDNAREIQSLVATKASALRAAEAAGGQSVSRGSTVRPTRAGNSRTDGGLPGVEVPSSGKTSERGNVPSPGSEGQGNGGPGASSLTEWGQRSFGKRLKADDRLRQAWRDTVKSTYRRETEVEWQERANQFIADNGVEGAAALYFDAESGLSPSDRMALGAQLVLRLDAEIRSAEIAGDADRVQLLDDILYEISEDVDSTAT